MSDTNYKPNGALQGDTHGMPNRGSKTGFNGDTYGADVSPDATNRMGSIKSATKSDPCEQTCPHKDTTV